MIRVMAMRVIIIDNVRDNDEKGRVIMMRRK